MIANSRLVDPVRWPRMKSAPAHSPPLLRTVTSGKLRATSTAVIVTVSVVAAIAREPRCTRTPLWNSATCHRMATVSPVSVLSKTTAFPPERRPLTSLLPG